MVTKTAEQVLLGLAYPAVVPARRRLLSGLKCTEDHCEVVFVLAVVVSTVPLSRIYGTLSRRHIRKLRRTTPFPHHG